ncbi:MAG: SPOR domain-containing protein [Bacteroidales bacterium]|nr:SPOR domain-containing protein [Bacteroidales bacterium]MBN2755979.1 SPOR domain-containing protein [Bacteroidales bacterium]
MNKLKFINIIIALLFATNLFSSTYNSNLKSGYENRIIISKLYLQLSNLKNKDYYEKIFTKDERKQLAKSDKYLNSAKKYMEQYESYQSEIDKYYTIAEATSSEKSKDKALKKAKKLEIKALKKGEKALSYYQKANSIRSKIYSTAINRIRLTDDSESAKLGRKIELRAKSLFDEAISIEKTAPIHDKKLKFNAYNEANNKKLQSFSLQEDAFGFYAKDKKFDPKEYSNDDFEIDTDDVVKTDSSLFPVYVEQYNPLVDNNLYKSKANIILPKLNLSNEELNLIVEANRKNQFANELLHQVDEAYIVIDSLNIVAEMVKDETEKDRIKQNAVSKEQNAFYKLLKATNTYLEVNKLRYEIYKKHIAEVKSNRIDENNKKAIFYEQEADNYYSKANNEIIKANKMMYKSDQYISLMGANDLQLYSLQLIESSYGLYMNMPNIISENVDTLYISDNTINTNTTGTEKEKVSTKLSWEVLSTYSYTKEKPKPVKYQSKKGVVFNVQLGIFKGYLPPHRFNTVDPVIFDKFVKNPYRRYMVGEYFTFEAAELALQKVKIIGYSDAFIVAKHDGIRKNYASAKSLLILDNNYNYMRDKELAKLNGINSSTNNNLSVNSNRSGNVVGQEIKNTNGLVYLVQLGMFKNPISYEQILFLEPVYTEIIPNQGTKYMIGTFASLSEARNQNNKIKQKGIKDSYVIAYYNGNHIKLDDAKKFEKQPNTYTQNQTTYTKEPVNFKIQVGAYSNQLSSNDEQKLKAKFLAWDIDKQLTNGMNIYTIGNYKTYNEANQLKKKIMIEGHKDIFIVAFKGNQKISISEAIKISGK